MTDQERTKIVDDLLGGINHEIKKSELKTKSMQARLTRLILTAIIGISGFVLLWVYAEWQLALGITLCFWATKLEIKNELKA